MAKNAINTRLENAVRFHQAGQLAEAERLYDQVLALDRANPDALNLKGVIANAQGRHAEAIALFDRAIVAAPKFPDVRYNRGLALATMGRHDDALQSYLQALTLNPLYADARLNLGLLLHAMGRTADATGAFRAMTKAVPNDARGFYNLGTCLEQSLPAAPEAHRATVAEEARGAFTRTLQLDPKNPDAHFAFANLHAFLGEYGPAAERLKAALALKPKWPDDLRANTLNDLGENLRKAGQFADAVGFLRQASALRPDDNIIKFNLAGALADHQMPEKAKAIYEDLITADPAFVRAHVNLASIYRDENRLDDSLALLEHAIARAPSFQAYSNMAAAFADKGWLVASLIVHDKAVALKGDDFKTRYNRAIALLNIGDLARGWPDYDLRFLIPSENVPGRPTPPPYWKGEDIAGKRLFIWTEQGVGDEALYASMIPEMIARAGHCTIETSARMTPVFARSFPQATVVPRVGREEALKVAADADVQISAASLGQYLRTDLTRFPKHGGYLKADPVKRDHLRRRYEDLAQGRRIVGLAWKSKRQVYGGSKSSTPVDLGAILNVPGVMFVNLQYGDVSGEIADARGKLGVDIYQDAEIDPLADMDGFFAQTAAMDLVISTSNSTVHVAGSMNIPTWLLLPYGRGALWYWFLRRSDSPWYPSIKITRASGTTPDQAWETEPSVRVAADLAQWVAQPRSDA